MIRRIPAPTALSAALMLFGCGGETATDGGGGSSAAGGAPPTDNAAALEIACASSFACARLEDDSLRCWGDPAYQAPSGRFERLFGGTTGSRILSALDHDGNAVTWGDVSRCDPSRNCLENPPGPHHWVSQGGVLPLVRYFLDAGGRPTSSQDSWTGVIRDIDRVSPGARPQGPFVALVSSGPSVCGIRGDSTVTCWYDRDGLPVEVPDFGETRVVQLMHGGTTVCAITVEGNAICLEPDSSPSRTQIPGNDLVRIFAFGDTVGIPRCGLRSSGEVVCSEDTLVKTKEYLDRLPADQDFTDACGNAAGYLCVLRRNGKVACVGKGDGDFSENPLIEQVPEELRSN